MEIYEPVLIPITEKKYNIDHPMSLEVERRKFASLKQQRLPNIYDRASMELDETMNTYLPPLITKTFTTVNKRKMLLATIQEDESSHQHVPAKNIGLTADIELGNVKIGDIDNFLTNINQKHKDKSYHKKLKDTNSILKYRNKFISSAQHYRKLTEEKERQ